MKHLILTFSVTLFMVNTLRLTGTDYKKEYIRDSYILNNEIFLPKDSVTGNSKKQVALLTYVPSKSKNEIEKKFNIKKDHLEYARIIDMNIDILKENYFDILIDDTLYSVTIIERKTKQKDLQIRGIISGNLNNKIILSLRGSTILGSINLNNVYYNINTFKNKKTYLFKVSSKDQDDCGFIEPNDKASSLAYNGSINSLRMLESNSINDDETASLVQSVSSKLRILVLYTPAALDLFANTDIDHHIDLMFIEANAALADNNINFEWELAYSGLTQYTEFTATTNGTVARSTDLNRFRNDNDNFMDEVHHLRSKFSADLCLLITRCYFGTQCGGIASAIDADLARGFSQMNPSSWGGLNSGLFSHEIGHLLAARHHNDGNTNPYGYNHGYVDATNMWGTIMRSGSEFERLMIWSNPVDTYQGEIVGTATWNDNARVLRDEIPEKIPFFQPHANTTISSSDINYLLYGEITVKDYTDINSGTLANGTELILKSPVVNFNGEFLIEDGAEFEIINESVQDY